MGGGLAKGSVWIHVCELVPLLQGIGDTNLAHQCFRLALVNNNHHSEAYNNLAVLEMRKGHVEQVRDLAAAQRALCFLQRKSVLSGDCYLI